MFQEYFEGRGRRGETNTRVDITTADVSFPPRVARAWCYSINLTEFISYGIQ